MMRYKKGIIAVFSGFLVLMICVYLFFPGKLTVSKIQLIKCTTSAAQRLTGEEVNWEKWWPEATRKGYSFRITGKFYRDLEISLLKNDVKVITKLTFLPTQTFDSIALHWSCQLSAGLNPLKRIRQYQQAVAIKKEMTTVLSNLGSFLGKKENIYGSDIRDMMSRDSTLLATRLTTKTYPSTEEIYRLIGDLRTYIAGQGARETDPPMLHVRKEKDRYEAMVAIPIDRELKGNGIFFPKRFVPYKILSGEVIGGAQTAEKALDQLEIYIQDYQRTRMAIPFQSLVTERDRENDSTRWVTRVVAPVS